MRNLRTYSCNLTNFLRPESCQQATFVAILGQIDVKCSIKKLNFVRMLAFFQGVGKIAFESTQCAQCSSFENFRLL